MKYEMHVRVYRGSGHNMRCVDAGSHTEVVAESNVELYHKAHPIAVELKKQGRYSHVEYFLYDEQGKLALEHYTY